MLLSPQASHLILTPPIPLFFTRIACESFFLSPHPLCFSSLFLSLSSLSPPPNLAGGAPFPYSMAGARCSSSTPSIPVLCRTNPKLQGLTFNNPLFRSCASSSASVSSSRLRSGSKGGALSSFACSTSQFKKRVGFPHGKPSLLPSGVAGSAVAEVGERDWSKVLSALLPFVVAATAVAALAQPSTFTWWGFLLHVDGFV